MTAVSSSRKADAKRAENQVLREKPGEKRILLNDNLRRLRRETSGLNVVFLPNEGA